MPNLLDKRKLSQLTREDWLTRATVALSEKFFPLADGRTRMPEKWACSCGFPYKSREAIGQCWPPTVSGDGTTHMFVCPTQAEPVRVLDILLHEMGHAAVGCDKGHGKEFKVFCREVGLEGKATATVANPGTKLHDELSSIARTLGPYPHAAITKGGPGQKKPKKKKGGWVRLMSETEPEYRVVISPKQLEEHGAPRDPWGDVMVPAED